MCFHKMEGLGTIAQTEQTDERTDVHGDNYIPSKTLFAGLWKSESNDKESYKCIMNMT